MYTKWDMNKEYYCQCGCNQEIIIKPHHKYRNFPRYIKGHNIKLLHFSGMDNPSYGIPRTNEQNQKQSNKMKGRVSPRKRVKVSDETKIKMSEARLGVEPWNKGFIGKDYPLSGNKCHLYGKPPYHGKRIIYKSFHFRSTWELSFAKFLDSIDESWDYECKTFDLKTTTYTPDFYLPNRNLWVEIKGWWRDDAKNKFLKFLSQYSNEIILLIMHKPPYTINDLESMRGL